MADLLDHVWEHLLIDGVEVEDDGPEMEMGNEVHQVAHPEHPDLAIVLIFVEHDENNIDTFDDDVMYYDEW